MGYIVIAILILLLVGDLAFRIFWLYPRYDQFVTKYGNNPTYFLFLRYCCGAWCYVALSNRQAWRNLIILQVISAASFMTFLILVLVYAS